MQCAGAGAGLMLVSPHRSQFKLTTLLPHYEAQNKLYQGVIGAERVCCVCWCWQVLKKAPNVSLVTTLAMEELLAMIDMSID